MRPCLGADGDEVVVRVEPLGAIVLRVDDDAGAADEARGVDDPAERVEQQRLAEPPALCTRVDREPISATGIGYLRSLACSTAAIAAVSTSAMLSV